MVRLTILLLLALPAYGQVAPFVFVPSAGAPPGPDSVVFVVADTGNYASSANSSLTKAVNFGADDNRVAAILVNWFIDNNTGTIDSVEVNGVNATKVKSIYSGAYGGVEWWYLAAPASGSQNVKVSWHGSASMDVGFAVIGVSNAAQTFTATDTASEAEGNCGQTDSKCTFSIPTAAGSLALAGALAWGSSDSLSATAPAIRRVQTFWGDANPSTTIPRFIVSAWHDGSSPTAFEWQYYGGGVTENAATTKAGINIRKYE